MRRVLLVACCLLAGACHSPTGPDEPLWCVQVGEATVTDGQHTATATLWVSPVPGMNCRVPKTSGPTV